MIKLAKLAEPISSRAEMKAQRRELQRRLLLAREGSNADRWKGGWVVEYERSDRK